MLQFHVPDIHCDACIRSMTHAVRGIDQNATLQADLSSKLVRVETTAGTEAVAEAIRDAGFDVEPL